MTSTVDRGGRNIKGCLLPAAGIVILLATAVAGAYAWYSAQHPCDVKAVQEASNLLSGQLRRYDHVYQFATSASQASLGYPMATLQFIQMDTQEIEVPACLQKSKDELTGYMGAVNRAFQAFGVREAEGTIRHWIEQSDTHYSNFHRELEAVKQCAPVCIRQNLISVFQNGP